MRSCSQKPRFVRSALGRAPGWPQRFHESCCISPCLHAKRRPSLEKRRAALRAAPQKNETAARAFQMFRFPDCTVPGSLWLKKHTAPTSRPAVGPCDRIGKQRRKNLAPLYVPLSAAASSPGAAESSGAASSAGAPLSAERLSPVPSSFPAAETSEDAVFCPASGASGKAVAT